MAPSGMVHFGLGSPATRGWTGAGHEPARVEENQVRRDGLVRHGSSAVKRSAS